MARTTKYYVNGGTGAYLGGFEGDPPAPPQGAVEVPGPPPIDGTQRYIAGEWTAPAVRIPDEVTAAQARIALLRAGLLDDVKAMVAAAGGEIEIWFEYALTWRRDNVNVATLAGALGLTSDQVDGLFQEAGSV